MAIELAQAYVSLTVSADKIPRQINQALNGAASSSAADKAGASIGNRLSDAMGTAVKGGALAAGAAAAGFMGTAFVKGFSRLSSIDDAKGKLTSLGHSAESTAKIMESAMASVKGTSYGFGEAANIAASAVAAGVNPGKELTRYLSLTADAASIAGVSLAEMGQIINKVQTGGTAYTMEITQLADRGIPIWQYLAKEMGVAQGEMKKLVSEGKVDSATYLRAIENNIGGAATAATTVSSQFANLNAAMGRLGAAALEPTFNRLSGWLGTGITGVDGMTEAVKPLAEALDHKVFEEWGPKLGAAFEEFRKSQFAVDTASKLVTLFNSLSAAASATWPAVRGIGQSLAEAGATAAGAGFSLLLDTLNGLTPIVSGVLVPAVQSLSSLMQANQGVVTGLLATYAGFKLVSFLAATKSMQGLQTASVGAFRSFTTFGRGVADTQRMFASTGTQVGKLGASVAYLSTGQGNVAKLASTFRSASDGASRFGTAAGAAAVAGQGLKAAAGGLMGALGGPMGLAIMGTVGALTVYGQHQAKVAERNREIRQSAEELGKTLHATNGALTEQGQRAAATALENLKLSGSGRSLVEHLESVGVSGNIAARGLAGSRKEMQTTLSALEDAARLEAEVNKGRVGAGESGFGSTALGQLFNFGGAKDRVNEAQNALNDFRKLDEQAKAIADSQKRLNLAAGYIDVSGTATKLGTMTDTMQRFAESTGGAASKIDILNGGLSTLRGDQLSSEKAQQQVNDALRAFSDAASNGGAAAIDAGGKIDTTTEAGSRLLSAMDNVTGAFDRAGAAAYTAALQQGKSQEEAAVAAEQAAQKVRNSFIEQQTAILGSREAAIQLADAYGLFPKELRTNVLLSGTDEAEAALKALAEKERIARIKVAVDTYGVNSSQAFVAATNGMSEAEFRQRFPQYRADGGPIFGLGGPTSDSIPAMLSAGEHVLTASEVDAAGGHGAIYRMREAIRQGGARFAEGGAVGVSGIKAALDAARGVTGNKYVWGGTGPTGFDCSGFVGWLQQIAMGLSAAAAAGKRLYTTHAFFNGSGEVAGLVPGLGPAGTQFQVGVSPEHMSATIAGQPAEAGGSHGTSRLGSPAVGATDPQYSKWFHLPNERVAGGITGYARGGSRRQQDAPEWTESDQLDLDSAHLSVTEAKEARAKLNAADSRATDTDRQQADIAIRRAELRVVELQEKKDEAANWVPDGPAPEAPALAQAYEKEERERLRAQIAVDTARQDRNEVYADPLATENERLEADLALMDAQERLEEITAGKTDSAKGDYSLRGIVTRFGHGVVDAAVEGVFGQLPDEIASSRWLTTDWASLIPDEYKAESAKFSKADIDKQLPITPGVPGWLEGLLKVDDFAEKIPANELERLRKLAPKVYDSGGWLMPGETAINLSSRPEPIFNSPEQLRQFAGQLMPAEQVAPVDARIIFERDVNVTDLEGFKRELRWEQDRVTRPYRRR